jgi:hypothetical protein
VPTNDDLDQRKADDRAKREQQFRDVEASLNRASDLIEASKREVERSRQLTKESDEAQEKTDRDRHDRERG